MKLETLYNEYSKLVYNLALQYVQNIEDAEEITQDVFLAIHRSLDDFKHQSKLSTWIYRITINKSLDHLKAKRAKKRFSFLISLFPAEDNEGQHKAVTFNHPGVQLEQKEALENLFRCMNQLSGLQKTVLILNKIEGKSMVEIAEIIQRSPKATESLLQRARINLLQQINRIEGNES